MVDRFWYLKNSNLFDGLSSDDYRRLEAKAVVRRFRKKEIIYFPNDPGESIMVLFEGRVKIKSVTPAGKEAILAFIEPGEVFGELALLDGADRGDFAEAAAASTVCAIPRDAILSVMASHPETALKITKMMGLRQQRIENRVKNMLFRSFRERMAALLIELADRYGRRNGDQEEISLKLSHQELASLIGATRETVTILLGELQSEGFIRVQRRQIILTNRAALSESVI